MPASRKSARAGLSPPTRGNRPPTRRGDSKTGSIPAHAGEPQGKDWSGDSAEVYPRPRGGTAAAAERKRIMDGLSPPTRGNLVVERPPAHAMGSIPAHAGEPANQSASGPSARVYPRPRGGTGAKLDRRPRQRGLSPPTRGNPGALSKVVPSARSIPAHAGEPRPERPLDFSHRVYPRPRGGTGGGVGRADAPDGLSPPTRGNLPVQRSEKLRSGSIPAHAGEPKYATPGASTPGVYPRPRGGTPP